MWGGRLYKVMSKEVMTEDSFSEGWVSWAGVVAWAEVWLWGGACGRAALSSPLRREAVLDKEQQIRCCSDKGQYIRHWFATSLMAEVEPASPCLEQDWHPLGMVVWESGG